MGDVDRLKWRCRRGTLELDLFVTRYLDKYYPTAPVEHQRAFERLLEYSDENLNELFMGKVLSDDEAIAAIVNEIRNSSEDTT